MAGLMQPRERGPWNFLTGLLTGGVGAPGDMGQAAQDTSVGLLNARMQSLDPTGRIRAMSGQHAPLQGPQIPYGSEALQTRLGGDPSAPESLLGMIGAPEITDIAKGAGIASRAMDLAPGGLLAQSLFHGTPHKFDVFDLKKIGTGEGAQAYGHGLYFAESPGVAKSYQTTLNDPNAVAGRIINEVVGSPDDSSIREIMRNGSALKRGDDSIETLTTRAKNAAPRLREFPDETVANALERYSKETGGHLYEVDIPDETIGKMLDWDAPLSEQPELKRIFDEFGLEAFVADADPTGGVVVREMENFFSQSKTGSGFEDMLPEAVLRNMDNGMRPDEAVSQYLNEAGIPGIRFFDGQSRGKVGIGQTIGQREKKLLQDMVAAEEVGDTALVTKLQKQLDNLEDDVKGTRNIVVFNPDDISKVKRDGELVYKTGKGGLLGEASKALDLKGNKVDLPDGFLDEINETEFVRGINSTDDGKRLNSYFTDDASTALSYIDKQEGQIIRAKFNIKNPLIVDYDGAIKSDRLDSKYLKMAREQGKDAVIFRNIADRQGAGYRSGLLTRDAIIHESVAGGTPSNVVIPLEESAIIESSAEAYKKPPFGSTKRTRTAAEAAALDAEADRAVRDFLKHERD